MFERIKKMFETKEKRIENLVSLLIILIITLIVINKILENEENNTDYKNEVGVELAQTENEEVITDLEKRLEIILSKISGVGQVSVLLTYKDNGSISPIYNVNSSISVAEENDTSGNSKITKSENLQKEVISSKNNEEIILEKKNTPIIEGAIIAATRR